MDITKLLIYVYVVFFISAGINHFLNPQFYDSLVPNFIPYPRFVHQFTGVLEMLIPFLFLGQHFNNKHRKATDWTLLQIPLALTVVLWFALWFFSIFDAWREGTKLVSQKSSTI